MKFTCDNCDDEISGQYYEIVVTDGKMITTWKRFCTVVCLKKWASSKKRNKK